ncbi:MAG: hypothetical protein ACYCST_19170 [Acidimicrobiales bacterium]
MGALAEHVSEGAVVVLPEELQATYRLPEEVSFTEDPEIGREEGYYLLSLGEPMLRSVAESVLSRGDVGHGHLAWPDSQPPTPAGLERRAREQIQPDHGRVDVSDAPLATHLEVLRVGAMVTYSLSIDEQVQELEEVFVLGDGAEVAKDVSQRLSAAATEPGAPQGYGQPSIGGIVAADLKLSSRAKRRAAELSRQSGHRLRDQLQVVDDYYGRLLASIGERLERAPGDRARLLSQQADATRIEWQRRRAEVSDEITPTTEVRPFRLHVIWLPAWHVMASVRRGARSFSLPLTYLPLTSSFLLPACPSCGSTALLVAGKDRLACRACVTPEVSKPVEPKVVTEAEPGRSTRADLPATRRTRPGPLGPPTPRVAAKASGRATPKGTRGRTTAKHDGRRADKTGERLTRLLWEAVLSHEGVRPRDVVRWSPIEALFRLYGPRGPGFVVGMRDTEMPRRFLSDTSAPSPDGVVTTAGYLETSAGRELRFYFAWRLDTGRLLSLDAWPLERAGPLLAASDGFGAAMRERLAGFLCAPPFPSIALEPAERHLLRHATEFAGLGYASRCLAAWWWWQSERPSLIEPGLIEPELIEPELIEPELAEPGLIEPGLADEEGTERRQADVLAAAVEAAVARRAGIRLTVNAVAERYGSDLEATRRQIRRIQKDLKVAPAAGW